ncbi:GNAT family N-acetyltransferase [Caldalkalibacillus salinus]|uniref:GNAT family N-acetyltransferase n=1 Tax=Caldalkalibacillus salinus TaxID=2803787 RepID=UPI001924AF27|nr:GNAT family N-acetyltransferase [Caldalkalibacillus salinus]
MTHGEPLIMSFEAKDGTSVKLRPAKVEDAEQIVKSSEDIVAAGKYLQKESPKTVEQERDFIKKARERGHMYTAVEIEGQVVGIARILREQLEMKKHVGKFRTWLSPDAQGKGIGKKIMEYTIEWAKQNDLHKVWLTVFAHNVGACKLYERYGFVTEGNQKEQVIIDGEFQDEVFMAYFVQKQREQVQ